MRNGNKQNNDDVFRDEIKESRGAYYVEYQPADGRFPFAHLQIVFPGVAFDVDNVAVTMEKELASWLKRFPVPIMLTAWDRKEDAIRIPSGSGDSILMGYLDLKTSQVIQKWGLLLENELPEEQAEEKYLERVYKDVPFRLRKDVREKVEQEWKDTARGLKLFKVIFVFVVAVPVLIEIISLGVPWIGHTLAAISISTGLYKVAKRAGWINKSERQKKKDEEDLKHRHYIWHCERNPKGFERLKAENFKREATERTRKESESLRASGKEKPL